ncbi:Txe/YoeB family addiction module toxin [Tabrizicola aquatica]|uniref:Txe/YoeB family addiction module toxin n=1 Tax=Tabrizicola aquatica TaxID=909926 RepID=UPI003CCB8123
MPPILTRINTLIEECRRHPFTGTGKPELLKGDLTGWWSRRITSEHRQVYRVSGSGSDQCIQIAQCRYHY